MLNNKVDLLWFSYSKSHKFNDVNVYRKLPEGELKRFLCCVINFDKVPTWMWGIKVTQEQLPRITIIKINALPTWM